MNKWKEILNTGNYVVIKTKNGAVYQGMVMPRYEIFDPNFVTIKLENGYNVGINLDNIIDAKVLPKQTNIPFRAEGEIVPTEELTIGGRKRVYIVATGGTIASKIDYVTGGVKPVFTTEELLTMIPELNKYATYQSEILMNIFSEDMRPQYWEKIALRISQLLQEDPERGIVITHGTDTLGYTSSALSFALQNIPSPIALVGSQRSSDRPSSDSAINLVSSSIYATSNICEVSVVMHGETSDSYALAHRGTRVRKMHTSRRDAFQSISSRPIARIHFSTGNIEMLRDDVNICKGTQEMRVFPKFSDRVALIKYYPGMPNWLLDVLPERGIEGVVIEGTGLGHVSQELIDSIRYLVDKGIIVVMTSQCLFGRVNLNVYSKGRAIAKAGAISGENMLPETAYVKLSWLLGNFNNRDEIKKLLTQNIAGEIESREQIGLFPRWI